MNREQDLIAENQDLNLQRWREGAMRLLLNQGLNPAAQLLTFLYRPHGAPTLRLCFITECKCGTASVFITVIICRDGTLWSRRRHQLSKHEWGGYSENSRQPPKRIWSKKQAEEMSDEQRGEAGSTFGSYSGNRIYNGVMQRTGVGNISHYLLALSLGL